jgi:hypothetical protein
MRRSPAKADAADFLEAAFRRDGYEAASLQLAEMEVNGFAAGTFSALGISLAYEIGGDYESAIDWLEIGVDRFEPDAPYIGALIRRTGMREHPRYKALLKRMGLDYWADESP